MTSNDQGLKTALFRFGVVSAVLAKTLVGESLAKAVADAAKTAHAREDGRLRKVSARSIYRWTSVYRRRGFEGLFDTPRAKIADSAALGDRLVQYLVQEKAKDPDASIPEVIRRAVIDGIIADVEAVDRVTVYRCAKRLNLPIYKKIELGKRNRRRFARRHRMRVVLADGKHFRAGAKRLKRVAINFLDDASRFGLRGVVTTSENKLAFIAGLFAALLRFGKMSALYLDNGVAFVAKDVALICAKLGIAVIHGEIADPASHGKIEKFNDTLENDLLRGLDKNAEVDPDLKSLELRLNHYLAKDYNTRKHEGIRATPEGHFLEDDAPLDHVPEEVLRNAFVLYERRRVSKDNVVMVDGVAYEMPLGYAGTYVTVGRHMLDAKVSVMHEGKVCFLAPVDVYANAKTPRGRRAKAGEEDTAPPITAAMKRFAKDFPPIVGSDGGLLKPRKDGENP